MLFSGVRIVASSYFLCISLLTGLVSLTLYCCCHRGTAPPFRRPYSLCSVYSLCSTGQNWARRSNAGATEQKQLQRACRCCEYFQVLASQVLASCVSQVATLGAMDRLAELDEFLVLLHSNLYGTVVTPHLLWLASYCCYTTRPQRQGSSRCSRRRTMHYARTHCSACTKSSTSTGLRSRRLCP